MDFRRSVIPSEKSINFIFKTSHANKTFLFMSVKVSVELFMDTNFTEYIERSQ
ncbi:hypothetical protein CWI38_0010p0020 [Hamiltosporidium tvaerminnensis]|uniref:Uncharacterized protein n=2 Tax=Hamiltosporidium TaxID=1176354 RepID=A0A4Q9LMX4_9MICR|nr:hypothetical protein CWI36_0005p0030 [Hamiltosporidium magnivora]TBU09729.1 hypothetical protein CWI36_0004p0030 [Hamiltosporidium magnivora]TBU20907.1 hypothetical protein CWI38_0010p0020 [Hamiltosporidium tvaerminnensis]